MGACRTCSFPAAVLLKKREPRPRHHSDPAWTERDGGEGDPVRSGEVNRFVNEAPLRESIMTMMPLREALFDGRLVMDLLCRTFDRAETFLGDL